VRACSQSPPPLQSTRSRPPTTPSPPRSCPPLAQVNHDDVRAQFAELEMRLCPGGVVQPPLARTPRFSMAGSASALSLSTVATPARVHQAAAAPPRGSPSASPPLESPAAGAPTATGLTLASDVQAVQGRESYEGYEGS